MVRRWFGPIWFGGGSVRWRFGSRFWVRTKFGSEAHFAIWGPNQIWFGGTFRVLGSEPNLVRRHISRFGVRTEFRSEWFPVAVGPDLIWVGEMLSAVPHGPQLVRIARGGMGSGGEQLFPLDGLRGLVSTSEYW